MLRCAQHDSQDGGQGSPSHVTLSPFAALRGNSAQGRSQEKSSLQMSGFST